MASTQADLDALIQARNSGALTVQYADRRVTYRSLAEIERTIDRIQRELGQSEPNFSRGQVSRRA